MRRLFALTALALLAFASMAWGQSGVITIDTTVAGDTIEVEGEAPVHVEAMRFVSGIPAHIAVSWEIDDSILVGERLVTHVGVIFAVQCYAFRISATRVVGLYADGEVSHNAAVPPSKVEPFRPEPGDLEDAVLRYACRGFGERS
jgi:hypothetical protein